MKIIRVKSSLIDILFIKIGHGLLLPLFERPCRMQDVHGCSYTDIPRIKKSSLLYIYAP